MMYYFVISTTYPDIYVYLDIKAEKGRFIGYIHDIYDVLDGHTWSISHNEKETINLLKLKYGLYDYKFNRKQLKKIANNADLCLAFFGINE